jgi:hypothetical protein
MNEKFIPDIHGYIHVLTKLWRDYESFTSSQTKVKEECLRKIFFHARKLHEIENQVFPPEDNQNIG